MFLDVQPNRIRETQTLSSLNVRVKIDDVEIDQHFFVQETSSHPVILGKPYITAAHMETKVLDNGSVYA